MEIRLPTRTPVHPHARGEHGLGTELRFSVGGSSPRTWGTRDALPQQARELRFIPTHVGNTGFSPDYRHTDPVHPHARGEHTSHNFLIFK